MIKLVWERPLYGNPDWGKSIPDRYMPSVFTPTICRRTPTCTLFDSWVGQDWQNFDSDDGDSIGH